MPPQLGEMLPQRARRRGNSVLEAHHLRTEQKARLGRWAWGVGSILVGAAFVGAAVALGMLLPIDPTNETPPPYRRLSMVVGWLYFIAWSVSFWPQVFLNLRRSSVAGLSIDFELYNMLGFTCYTAYNAALLWSPSIRAAYTAQYGNVPTVRVNDFVFSTHAMVVTALTLAQCIIYKNGRGRVSLPGLILILGALAAIALGFALAVWLNVNWASWLNFLEFISYMKIGVTLVKYFPQAILNCRRGSTEGWSIWNVWLDFSGGLLSITQQCIDSASTGNWSGVYGDPVKLALGACSIIFDLLFLSQHYVCLNRRSTRRQQRPSINGLGLDTSDYAELNDPTASAGSGNGERPGVGAGRRGGGSNGRRLPPFSEGYSARGESGSDHLHSPRKTADFLDALGAAQYGGDGRLLSGGLGGLGEEEYRDGEYSDGYSSRGSSRRTSMGSDVSFLSNSFLSAVQPGDHSHHRDEQQWGDS